MTRHKNQQAQTVKQNQGVWGKKNPNANLRSEVMYAPVKSLSLSEFLWEKAMESTDVPELLQRPAIWID
jgi:hypothetical protein